MLFMCCSMCVCCCGELCFLIQFWHVLAWKLYVSLVGTFEFTLFGRVLPRKKQTRNCNIRVENTKIQKIPRTLQDTGDTESLSAIERQKHFLKRCTFQTWNSKLTSPIPSYNNSDFLRSDTDWYCKTNGQLTNAWNKKPRTLKRALNQKINPSGRTFAY